MNSQKTFLLLAFAVALSLSISTTALAQAGASSSPQAAGNSGAVPSGPRIWLQANQPLPVNHVAVGLSNGQGMIAADSSVLVGLSQSQPVSMASGDLDGDGLDDLIVGYSNGFISIQRGNLDAFAPQSTASFHAIERGEFPSPFVLDAKTFSVPLTPDFIALGSFSSSGNKDLAVAAKGGSTLYLFPGDGKGNFGAPQTVKVAGGITALASGQFGSAHNTSLVVAISGPGKNFSLAVYVPTSKGLTPLATFGLQAAASNIAFGSFGDAGPDVAFLSGGKVQILRSSTMKLAAISLSVTARAFTLGSFIYDRNGGAQIALVAPDGSIQIAVRNEFDPQAYTVEEFQAIRQARINHQSAPSFVPAISFPVNGWKIVESFPGAVALGPNQAPVMFRARTSSNGADDVMVLNGFSGQLTLVSHPDLKPGAPTFAPGQVSLRPYSGSPVTALPMRVNVDGRPGVMAIHQGEIAPSMIMPIPDPTFTVNTTADLVSANPNACLNNVAGQCSVREAIIEANATAGTDTIMIPAGTFTLTLPRAASPAYDASTGTLNVNDSVNIVGAGQNSTIIQAGTTAYNQGVPNGVDMVMAVNEDITIISNATASISNLTIQNGHNRGAHGNDGDGGCMEFDTGASGNATLTLTSVTLQNCDTTQGSGGALASFNFTNPNNGFVTITNSIIQGNSVADNLGNAVGGGVWVSDPSRMVMSNSQVLNNLATQNAGTAGFGGGLYILSSGGSEQTQIHASTISLNQSSFAGGGVFDTANLVIDQSTVISGNKNGQNGAGPTDGGGLFIDPEPGLTATLAKVTITGNHSSGTGGAIATGTGGSSVFINFSRLAGNTAATTGSNLENLGSVLAATNDWWGTNSPGSTIHTTSGTTAFDPFIVLTNTASPNKIGINQSSTLTGDMSKDNHGNGAALAGNLDVLNGLPITFGNAVLGTIAEAQPEALNASAQATATFNAGGVGGSGSADATVDQQTVTASITILQPPSITKSVSPTTVTPNTPSTITFSINNGNTVTIDSSFTDSLPAGLVVATPPNVVNACGGTVTATAGTGSISFANPSLAVGTCSIQVNVQSAVDNVYNNSVTINSADAGTGNTSSATLTVITPPAIAKAFGAATIPLNGTTSLTFTLNSTNTNLTLNGVAFTDNLPAGLVVATPGNLTNTCGGTATAANGSSSVALSGASLAPGATCTVSVNVQGTTAGAKSNSVSVTSTNGGNGNTSNASITVIAPPTLAKAFGVASIPLNGTTSLSFSINNPNSSSTLTGIGFTDTLPAGLVVSTPNGLTGSCGAGTITATAGTNVISLSGASLAAGASCTFSVNVTGTGAGTQNNTSGNVTSNEGGTGGSASASLIVVAPPATAKAFTPAGIQPNGTSTMTITITNPAANPVALTNLTFTDNFPLNLVVATPNGLTNTCGGTATATAGSGTVSLTGGTVAANSSCTVSASVTSAFTGSYPNDTGPVSSDNGGTGADGTATLSVAFPPTISKVFVPDTIAVNTATLLSFTINNPNSFSAFPNNDVTLTGISFTDNLPAGLVVANPSNISNSCDGTVTANPGSSIITLTGGDLGPAVGLARIKPSRPLLSLQPAPLSQTLQPLRPKALGSVSQTPLSKSSIIVRGGPQQLVQPSSSGSCFISVEVQPTVVVPPNSTVTLNNTTGPISANESGAGVASNTATLTVGPAVAPPTVAKAFGASTIPLGGTTSLTFVYTNPNAATELVNISLDDMLPSGLVVANPNGLSGSCFTTDGAAVSANPGSNDVSLTALVLPGTNFAPANSCSLTVNVTGTTSGVKNNTSGNVTAVFDDGTGHFIGITGGTASASILVVLPPVIAKAFNPNSIALSQTTSLGFAITNPAANPIALTGVSFTDVLQTGLTVTNGSSAVCGGTLTTSGGNTISLSGATLAVNGSCNFSLTVTPTAFGNYTNTTTNVTSNEGGAGNAATATLTVFPVVISPGSVNFGDVDSDQSATRTVTISNNGNAAVSLSISLTPGTGTSANKFTFSTTCLSSLPAHQSCTVTITFTAPHVTSASQLGVSTATLNVVSAGFTQHVPLSANVIDPEPQFTPGSLSFGHVTVHNSSILTTTLKNVGLTALNITGFTITGNQPGDFSQTNNCPASLAPGNSCTVTVTFTPKATGNRDAKLNLIANDEAEFVPISGIGQ